MAIEYKIIGGDGREYRPESLEELRHWCEDGRVGPGTPVWRGDEQQWAPAAAREELRWDLPKPTPIQAKPAAEAAAAPNLIPAGFWIRLSAYLFDWMLLGSLISVLTLPWAKVLNGLQEDMYREFKSVHPDLAVVFHAWAVLSAVYIPAQFLYFVSFNTAFGGTPGKLALGLRILDARGARLTWKRAVARHCGVLISEFSMGLGFLLLLSNPEKRALHDLMAGTRVVFWGLRRRPSRESAP